VPNFISDATAAETEFKQSKDDVASWTFRDETNPMKCQHLLTLAHRYEDAIMVLEDLRGTIEDIEDAQCVESKEGKRAVRFQKVKYVNRYKKLGAGDKLAEVIGSVLAHKRFRPHASTSYHDFEITPESFSNLTVLVAFLLLILLLLLLVLLCFYLNIRPMLFIFINNNNNINNTIKLIMHKTSNKQLIQL